MIKLDINAALRGPGEGGVFDLVKGKIEFSD